MNMAYRPWIENLAGFVNTFTLNFVLRIGIFGNSLGP